MSLSKVPQSRASCPGHIVASLGSLAKRANRVCSILSLDLTREQIYGTQDLTIHKDHKGHKAGINREWTHLRKPWRDRLRMNEGPLQTDERELVPTAPLSLSCQFAVPIRVHSRLVSVFVSSVIFVYCKLRL
jgi:hypothetical protein